MRLTAPTVPDDQSRPADGPAQLNAQRRAHPLVPLSIFRIKGLAGADATQVLAWAGFYSMFFFVTLYMQNVLGYSPLRTGASYMPVTVGIGLGSTVATKMFIRTGTRPIIVSGSLLAAGASSGSPACPVDGTYVGNLLHRWWSWGMGLGLLYAGVQTAANAGTARQRPLPRGGRSHRFPRPQHPRRTRRYTRNPKDRPQ